MQARQDVAEVGVLVLAHPGDVGVQPRFPGPVAQPAGELGEVLRVVEVGVQLTAVEALQPRLSPDLLEVVGDLVVVHLGTRDQTYLRLDLLHSTLSSWLPRPGHTPTP
ncbi:hypothetical protein BJF83_00940 [Nocardiopsis sp. CNR-923]|nr:hypothetical protein BJF83_00940 [Nocardiopsis sp. CNR-923]